MNWYTYAANNPLRFVDPTGFAYEDFKKETGGKISGENLISRVENLFSGRGFVTNSELRIRERDRLTEGIKNDPTVASVQAALFMMGYDLGQAGIDGIQGSKTSKAIRIFKQAVGLDISETIDSDTLEALDLAVKAGYNRSGIEETGIKLGHYRKMIYSREDNTMYWLTSTGTIEDSWEARHDFVAGFNEHGQPRASLPEGEYSNTYALTPGIRYGDSFGTFYIKTGDSRGRDIHGGGSGLPDPYASRQGWRRTYGCIRMQNADGEALSRLMIKHGNNIPLSVVSSVTIENNMIKAYYQNEEEHSFRY